MRSLIAGDWSNDCETNACRAGMWKSNPSRPQMYCMRKTLLKSLVGPVGLGFRWSDCAGCSSFCVCLIFPDGQLRKLSRRWASRGTLNIVPTFWSVGKGRLPVGAARHPQNRRVGAG